MATAIDEVPALKVSLTVETKLSTVTVAATRRAIYLDDTEWIEALTGQVKDGIWGAFQIEQYKEDEKAEGEDID